MSIPVLGTSNSIGKEIGNCFVDDDEVKYRILKMCDVYEIFSRRRMIATIFFLGARVVD